VVEEPTSGGSRAAGHGCCWTPPRREEGPLRHHCRKPPLQEPPWSSGRCQECRGIALRGIRVPWCLSSKCRWSRSVGAFGGPGLLDPFRAPLALGVVCRLEPGRTVPLSWAGSLDPRWSVEPVIPSKEVFVSWKPNGEVAEAVSQLLVCFLPWFRALGLTAPLGTVRATPFARTASWARASALRCVRWAFTLSVG